MKSTGVVRKLDELGRIVLPIEIRKSMGFDIREPIEIYVEDNKVVLRKHEPSCLFCGSYNISMVHNDKNICEECVGALGKKINNH